MKMKFLPISESILFIALIIVGVCGFLENIAANIPFALEFTTAIVFLLLLFALFAVLRDINNRLLPYQTLGIGAIAFTSNHLFTEASSYIADFPVLYFIVVIATALIGVNRAWTLPLLVFVFGDFFQPIVSRAINGTPFDTASIISQYYEKNIISVFYLFISGVFPSIISSHFLRIAFVEKNKPSGKRSETQNTPPPRTDTSQLTKTQILTSGELQTEHKTSVSGVDDLLASVVYFMKRNFKAYSALGFTFDALTQSFILNSFHSKSININNGISIASGNGI
ncbi:MAG: hypothetical protein ACM31E_11525, partial [Fibrobacterota bacterium]